MTVPSARAEVRGAARGTLHEAVLPGLSVEMLGARFVSRRGEPLGRHLVVIDALAA